MKSLSTNLTKSIVACSLIAGLASCGASTKKEGEKARETNVYLAGEWRDDCHKSDWVGLTHSKEILTLSLLGDYRRTVTSYDAESCDKAQIATEFFGTA